MIFVQLTEGVDDETWLYHLHRQDYSYWFEEAIKDETLAAEAAKVEKHKGISANESRDLIRSAIEQRYTLPT